MFPIGEKRINLPKMERLNNWSTNTNKNTVMNAMKMTQKNIFSEGKTRKTPRYIKNQQIS